MRWAISRGLALQRRGHRVERAGEVAELVGARVSTRVAEVAGRDRRRRAGDALDGRTTRRRSSDGGAQRGEQHERDADDAEPDREVGARVGAGAPCASASARARTNIAPSARADVGDPPPPDRVVEVGAGVARVLAGGLEERQRPQADVVVDQRRHPVDVGAQLRVVAGERLEALDLLRVARRAAVERLEVRLAPGGDEAAQAVLEADRGALELGPDGDRLLRAQRPRPAERRLPTATTSTANATTRIVAGSRCPAACARSGCGGRGFSTPAL